MHNDSPSFKKMMVRVRLEMSEVVDAVEVDGYTTKAKELLGQMIDGFEIIDVDVEVS